LIVTKIKKDLEKRTSENANAIAINELAEESKTTISGEISHIINYEKQQEQKEKFANDGRLNHLNIPQGLIESLNQAEFTIDRILNSTPSDIAEALGIDYYVAQIIHQETKNSFDNNSKILLNI
jgi:hypothetical protein